MSRTRTLVPTARTPFSHAQPDPLFHFGDGPRRGGSSGKTALCKSSDRAPTGPANNDVFAVFIPPRTEPGRCRAAV